MNGNCAGVITITLGLMLSACTVSRVGVYRGIVDPMVGTSKKQDVDRVLGQPAMCSEEKGFRMCEYRTAAGRNDPIPYAMHHEPGFGPDLSPYDHFDVLHLYYDDFGTLKDWDPIVVKP